MGSHDTDQATSLLDDACNQGVAAACYDLATMATQLEGDRYDTARLLDDACQFGHPPACVEHRRITVGDDPDTHQSRCDDSDAYGCHLYATHLDRIGSGADDERIEQFYRKACEGGDATGCTAYGRRLDARGADSDYIADILDTACEGGDAAGCHHLGILRERAGDDPTDALRRGCDGWHATSCFELAEHSSDDATELFERSCRLGSSDGCWQTALRLLDRPLPTELIRGVELLERACLNDHFPACGFAFEFAQRGADVDDAVSERACRAGHHDAC